MSCCTHCDDAGCRRCDPHLAAEAAGGEQGLTSVELELVALRDNLAVAQAQVRGLSAELAAACEERAKATAALVQAVANATREEREACARTAEAARNVQSPTPWRLACEYVAAAIRSRGGP